MKHFRSIDRKFERLVNKTPIRYATGIFFIMLAGAIALENNESGVLSTLMRFDYAREAFAASFIVAALLIVLVDDPFTYFLGTLPFLVYIYLAVVFSLKSGLTNPIIVLAFTFYLMLKIYAAQNINGGG